MTVLNELEKEKAERQRVYDEIYETLLKDMNKETLEPKVSAKPSSKPSSKTSTLSRTGHNRVPSFSMGGIRHYAKVKCVLVGDGGTGKTSIIHYFMHREKQQSYIPTVFDNRAIEVVQGNTHVTVNFWDTAGQDSYDKLRPLSYADSHVALLVFSVTSQTTLNNILAKWHPEFRHYCRKVPFILVGNKTDPMEDQQVSCNLILPYELVVLDLWFWEILRLLVELWCNWFPGIQCFPWPVCVCCLIIWVYYLWSSCSTEQTIAPLTQSNKIVLILYFNN